MLRNFLSILLFFISLTPALAGNTISIRGKVVDKTTRAPLSNTNVVIIGTQMGAATNSEGDFIIRNLSPGKYDLKAHRIDYHPQTIFQIKIQVGETKVVRFELTSRVLAMKPVEIQANKFSFKYQSEVSRIGFQQIEPRKVSHIPGMMDDISRVIQIYGSVMPASDYNSYFAVRGGSPEQNLVILDGVVIPNPYRFRLLLGGGLSLFDPNITEDVRLHIGGFPAEFGNFLSSVLEVDTREGNRHQISGRFSLNLIDASTLLEGPIGNGQGSWLLAARRTYYDLLANRFSKNNATYPNTTDLNGKFVINYNAQNKLSIRLMNCRESTKMLSEISDDINITEDSNIRLSSFTWLNTATSKLSHRLTVAYYTEKFDYITEKPQNLLPGLNVNAANQIYSTMDSDMINFSVREDLIYEFSDKIWMTRGIYFSRVQSNIDFQMPNRTLAFARREFPPATSFHDREMYLAFYMDDIYKIKPYFHIKAGLRYEYSSLIKKSAVNPRLSAWLKLNHFWSLDAFWGTCTQNPNILSSFLRYQPVDFSSGIEQLEPEEAMHFSFGATLTLGENVHAKFEFYAKQFENMILQENSENKKAANIGQGYSRGFEFYLQKQARPESRFSGIISYSYGKSKYKHEHFDFWLPTSFDRRHSYSVMTQVRIFGNLSANFLWRITSGLPYNTAYGLLLTSKAYPNEFLKYDTRKAYFPDYQRLDIRLNYEHRRGSRAFTMYLDVTNVYNHHNIYDQTWEIRRLLDLHSDRRQVKMRTLYMLPLIPSFGLSAQF